MEVIYLLVLGGMIFLSGSALVAFYWAVQSGQFRGLGRAATVIFDDKEPMGKMTDRFPEKNARCLARMRTP